MSANPIDYACARCGAAEGEECKPGCYDIQTPAARAAFGAGIIALGHAIRRAARRAEVGDLRNAVLGAAHQWTACWRPEDAERKAAAWGRLLDALARLAALAMEGRGDE